MEIVRLRHRFADCVKAGSVGHDLTKMAIAINLCRLHCEQRRPHPTSYYRNWFLLWKVVELKSQCPNRKSCFPGTCDPASTIEENDRVFTLARDARANTGQSLVRAASNLPSALCNRLNSRSRIREIMLSATEGCLT
jgi:hypothetical protein